LEPISDTELSKGMARFLRRLKYRRHEYFAVNEWKNGQRHHHILVRTNRKLTSSMVRRLWAASCPSKEFTHYCQPVEDLVRVACYVVKYTREGGELAPRGFRGRLVNMSQRFLIAPVQVLWAEQLADWKRQRQDRARAAHTAQESPSEKAINSTGQERKRSFHRE
jgi:hypothetical protein